MKEVGIDLGTSNTLIYVKGSGIVINEPSYVAFNKKSGEIVGVGQKAYAMYAKTPEHIEVSRPLTNGIIFDFEVTESMLSYFMNFLKQGWGGFMSRPFVIIGIPTHITEVEKGAVEDVVRSAGAKKVILIEEPLLAGIGAGLPVGESSGSIIIDIGGGTTEIGLISLGGLVVKKNLNIAGDKFDQDIIEYIKSTFNLLIGSITAERIKKEIGSAMVLEKPLSLAVYGRDLSKGLPCQITITDQHIREALNDSLEKIAETLKDVLHIAPPELAVDIVKNNIIITGGGGLLRGFPKFLEKKTQMPCRLADDPLTTVVRGEGLMLENFDTMRSLLS